MVFWNEAVRWGGPTPWLREEASAPGEDPPARAQPTAWETSEWIAGLRAGDRKALTRFAEVWGPRIYRYVARRVASPETAADLTQESLLRALEAIRKGSEPRDLAAWLYRIATNLLRDEYRRAGRTRNLLAAWPEAGGDGAAGPWGEPLGLSGPGDVLPQAVIDQMRREAVRRAIRNLPLPLQEVLVLRYYEALSVEQIAEVVGIPQGTVKSRLYRAYRRLEQELAPWREETLGAGPDREGSRHGR